jgi:hypothetical protein
MKLLFPKDLLQLIGTFWKRIVARPLLSERLLAGLLATHLQSEQNASDLTKAVSNLEIPAGQTTTFEKFTFVQTGFSKFEHGANLTAVYGNSYFYGSNSDNNTIYDIPENIISIPILYDNPVKPTKTYTENIDYKITAGKIQFRIPVPISTILYAKKVVRDTGFVYRHLGYVIGVNLSDSIFRKIPLAEFWRLFSYGPNYYNLLSLIGLCAKTPISRHKKELIQGVSNIAEGALVITDKDVYFIVPGQVSTVAPGQTVLKGTPLASGVEVLHYQQVLPSIKVPAYMRAGVNIKYGNKLLNSSRVILLKADIGGPEVVALQYLTSTTPLENKIILLANKAVPEAQVTNIQPEPTKIANSVAAPSFSGNQLQITPKCTSSLKYSFYGF